MFRRYCLYFGLILLCIAALTHARNIKIELDDSRKDKASKKEHVLTFEDKLDNLQLNLDKNIDKLELSSENLEALVDVLKKKSKSGKLEAIDMDHLAETLVEKEIELEMFGENAAFEKESTVLDLDSDQDLATDNTGIKVSVVSAAAPLHDPLIMMEQFKVINAEGVNKEEQVEVHQEANTGAAVPVEETVTDDSKKTKATTPAVWPAESVYEKSYDKVIELNNDNFDRVIAENDYVYTLFYAPWCSRSQNLLEEFEIARKLYNFSDSPPVLFAKLNCHQHTVIREKQSIGGNPVIQLFKNKGNLSVYPKGTSYPDSQVAFLRRNTLPPLTLINSTADYERLTQLVQYMVVGVFTSEQREESAEYQAYTRLVAKLPYKMPAALITDAKANGGEFDGDGIYLVKPQFDRLVAKYNLGDHKVSTLLKWLTTNYHPTINELTPENLHQLNEGMPSVVIFVDVSKYSTSMAIPYKSISPDLLTLNGVSKQFHKKIKFFFIDLLTFRDFKVKLGFKGQSERSPIAIIDIPKENHYLYPEAKEITIDNVSEFIQQFLDSQLEPHSYSSEPSAPADLPIRSVATVLVQKEFNEKVLQSKKNSLIYFNANWCGFSKTMDIYFQVATKKLQSNFNDLQIFDYNIVDNSLPNVLKSKIQDYPFIALFIATDINNPKTYNNTHDYHSIIQFVESNILETQNPDQNQLKELENNAIELTEKEIN